MSGSRTCPPPGPGYERFQQSCPCWEFSHLHRKITISGPGSKTSNNFIGSKLGQSGLAWEREARSCRGCWQTLACSKAHLHAAVKHWILMRYVLPELDMQVSAEIVLKYFLVRIGMLPRTFCLNWQALMAWDPILAIQDLLLASEWCITATLIPEHNPSDTQYLNPTNPRSPSPGSTPDSPGSTPDRIHS